MSSDFSDIAKRMQADWNQRVTHDYRFWMSEGHESDEIMWRAGERDFAILTRGIENTAQKSILEIGCGVGRLLRAAASRFRQVTGLDISDVALKKASELLSDFSNIQYVHGTGFDLQPVADKSQDLVVSFAAITSIPTNIIANYLREIQRVLKDDGQVCLQVYLGKPQSVSGDDTLHIRCFDPGDFRRAIEAAGFELCSVEELVLPTIQVSHKDLGIEANIINLKKNGRVPAPAEIISELLLPQGEVIHMGEDSSEDISGALEYWMTLNYARELAERGDTERARRTLEFAAQRGSATSIDVRDLLDRIIAEIERQEARQAELQKAANLSGSQDYTLQNLEVIKERFPDVFQLLHSSRKGDLSEIIISQSEDGPVVSVRAQCLDHATRPVAAGRKWAQSITRQVQYDEASELIVYGFGFAYHLQELQQLSNKRLSVIEPDVLVFKEAIRSRDLRDLLQNLRQLRVGELDCSDMFADGVELVVRPQSQTCAAGHCARVRSEFYGERGLSKLHPRIGVLGPLQGGTLPIAHYCSRVFRDELKQRTFDLDVSGFADGFHLVEDFVHDDLRQALLRGKYTEMVSEVIMGTIDEKPLDILICMAQAPITGAALEKLKQQGVITVLWFVEDYLRFTSWQYMARYFDYIFTIQRGPCIEAIKQAGAAQVHYLPTACDPFVHRPIQMSAEERQRWGSPVSFVGAGYHNRQQMFASLAEYPFKIWGTEWPGCRPFDRLVQEGGRRLKPDEYVKIFNASDININLHSSTERDGVDPFGDFLNPRTFELAACGAFQLVDERTHLPEAFEAGKELVTFNSVEDLKQKIDYYLAHPEERRKIAEAGRQRVLRDHTYQLRLREMLSIIYSSRFEHINSRSSKSSWKKVLDRAAQHPELLKRCEKAYERGEDPKLDALVVDIVTGEGKLSDTEKKLLFLHHVRKQIKRMRYEESGGKR